MRIIFDRVAGGNRSLRAPFDGQDVRIVEVRSTSGPGLYVVTPAADTGETVTFGAYGDELILVPEPKVGAEWPCPSCGSTEDWRVWYTTDESQECSVTFGAHGPEVQEYLGNSETGEGVGQDESLYCRGCGYTEELYAPPPVDKAAMDDIHRLLSGEVWDSSFLEGVAAIVERTGRVIAPPENETYSPISG